MSTNQVTEFAERLTLNSDNVDSVMTYPHPFTNGGMVVVFGDTADSYSQLHATVIQAAPPVGEMHIVKRGDLFLLSVPGFNALDPLDYPHMIFFLKNRGRVVLGEDLRQHIHEPSYMDMDSILTHLLDATACWFRDHTILHNLQMNAFTSLVDALDTRLRFLMAIALLCRKGQWDVQADVVPADFLSTFADEDLQKVWAEFDGIRMSAGFQNAEWTAAVRAVWLFEMFTRGLRRYAK